MKNFRCSLKVLSNLLKFPYPCRYFVFSYLCHKTKPIELMIKSWEDLRPRFEQLLNDNPLTASELEEWFLHRSSLMAEIDEDLAWRYINMTRDTQNEDYQKAYNDFIEYIQPNVIRLSHELNQKLVSHPLLTSLEEKYYTAIRKIKREIELYNERNIDLMSQEDKLAQEFARITGVMTIRCEGKELTLQQASRYLYDHRRGMRKKVYNKIASRRLKDYTKLNDLLDRLIGLRTQIARNAGYGNFRDFKHDELGRFDYTVDDVLRLNESVAAAAVPVMEQVLKIRRDRLGVDSLKPWDLEVDLDKPAPLVPFHSAQEFIEKTIKTLASVRPRYGEYFRIMAEKGYLDLESRKGKAPGGYNYPLLVSGVPFIFMNAAGTISDVHTIVHEAGHAVHSFLSRELKVVEQKELPSEVAELASMSMELISMEHWEHFFPDENELKRAKRYQLESVLRVLPWISLVDSFQQWLYTYPGHTTIDRYAHWLSLVKKYYGQGVDWSEVEWYTANLWQKQLHIFEVPFYYIEYGIAQLGAIAVWRNYKRDPQRALDMYERALSLGYSKPIPEIYKAAGIKFDFSRVYISELMQFVLEQYQQLI